MKRGRTCVFFFIIASFQIGRQQYENAFRLDETIIKLRCMIGQFPFLSIKLVQRSIVSTDKKKGCLTGETTISTISITTATNQMFIGVPISIYTCTGCVDWRSEGRPTLATFIKILCIYTQLLLFIKSLFIKLLCLN